PVIAALLGAGEEQRLAKAIEQGRPGIDADPLLLAVDAQGDRDRARRRRVVHRRGRAGRRERRRRASGQRRCGGGSRRGGEKSPAGQIGSASGRIVCHGASVSRERVEATRWDGSNRTAEGKRRSYSKN